MMTGRGRTRFRASLGGLIVITLAVAPAPILAATGTSPEVITPPSPTFETWWLIPIGFVVAVVLAIVVAAVRPAARRPIAAIGVFVAVGLVGTFFVLGGLFSDFSGQHRVAWPAVAVGGALIVAGTIAGVRLSRVRRTR